MRGIEFMRLLKRARSFMVNREIGSGCQMRPSGIYGTNDNPIPAGSAAAQSGRKEGHVSKGNVLVIDDDPQICRMMRVNLIGQGFEVTDVRNGMDGLELLRTGKYDLVLLDINMPGMSGVEVCREIRYTSDIVVIMLSVKASESDKTRAFDAGADDYMTKPFSFPELMARMRATLRRKSPALEAECKKMKLGEVQIDFEARQVQTQGDEQERLTPKEWEVLHYLATHANRTVTHRELLRGVWGSDAGDEKEYLRVFINRLRKKLESSPQNPVYLLTEPWMGYRLRLPQ
jgi:two-component system KDP operon response regulator KdpE